MRLIGLLIVLAVLVLVYESLVGLHRKMNRRRLFRMAKERSRETGLPLLVIGDPHNGVMSVSTGADYGCGDVCLDLTGCPRCPRGRKGYLENVLPTMDLRNYVVYVSCTLEYVSDLPKILESLRTVPYTNVFIVNVEWYCLTSYLYPYFLTREQPPRYVIYESPPHRPVFRYRELRGSDVKEIPWAR